MNRSVLLSVAIALSLLGIADSWYLFQSAVTDTALTCDIGAGLDGCNIVAQSPYSQIFGVPLALYGVGFFALVFALSAGLMALPATRLLLFFLALTAFGAVASVVFLFIQFVFIKALCIYCLLSALIAFGLFFVARELWKRRPFPVHPVL